MVFVIRNIKKKFNIQEAISWYEGSMTIIRGVRFSNRGAAEDIYIIGSGIGYKGLTINNVIDYISDNGIKHTGKGVVRIQNVITVNEDGTIRDVLGKSTYRNDLKLPVWVMV